MVFHLLLKNTRRLKIGDEIQPLRVFYFFPIFRIFDKLLSVVFLDHYYSEIAGYMLIIIFSYKYPFNASLPVSYLFVMSTLKSKALCPSFLIIATVSLFPASLMSHVTTIAPSLANLRHINLPIPEPPPVTNTICPEMSFSNKA